jgi:hypothetical protein
MTAILRIVNVAINSSSSISVTFTAALTSNLIPANVSILAQTSNVGDSQVLAVDVSGSTLTITCQPMIQFADYFLQFQSVENYPFISVNGNAQISMDGVSNRVIITGPISSDNPVLDFLQSFYQNNIYNITDPTTVVSSYIQSIAVNFARALYDIRQCKNENYLSVTIVDELHQRGPGPSDRLFEESAYNVFRVGLNPTSDPISTSFVFTEFPTFPVTLQRQIVTETAVTASNDNPGSFNINTLTFNLKHNPVSKVDSIVFTLFTDQPVYNYNIQQLGYQIENSEYDQAYASSYALLANNQVKLNEAILQDPNFSLDNIFSITITYEYQGLGIDIDPSSVDVYTTLQSVREVLPPIINVFNLQHAPITDSSNNIPVTGGVTFLNPNSNTGAPHPAFLTEIGFSLSALPSSPGVYCIDYPTGTVYVYGADSNNDGTGASPPLATYYYEFTYTSQIDYVYDPSSLSIVALPLGNLISNPGTIDFNYEQVLVPGIDYIAECHIESIYEPVGNRLIALNSLTTLNSPITDVFQIYNQSSGEIYLLNRWEDNTVYFSYTNPPRVLQQTGENATFSTVVNELLGINTTSLNSSSIRIFTIYLANNTIIDSTQDSIGSSINSSVFFTNGNVFVKELWYNQAVSISNNINRLSIGNYTVDYTNGIIYVAVSNTQNNDIGTVSYKMNSIVPSNPFIISVDDIYYQISILNPKNKHFSYVSFEQGAIIPAGLDFSDESLLNGIAPYQLVGNMVGAFVGSTFVPGVSNAVDFVRSLYAYDDLFNNSNPINFSDVSVSNNFNITVGSITGQAFEKVQYNGTSYYVTVSQLDIPYLSPGINFNFTVTRSSDSATLWNGNGVIVPGQQVILVLPGINNPQPDQMVSVSWTFSIVPLERIVVDYNKGNFYIDYTYVADVLLVSYEYGDNDLDFSQSNSVDAGTNYYVSYMVGANRDALLQNFGTLVNVPDLSTLDLSLNRERYREALQAALSSFIQGPTVAAIKNICEIITHVEPQVIESAFQVWSLGNNLLNPVGVESTGNFQLLPAHFGNGALINQPGQTVTMPASSSIRLEEGTFETWVLPQWNGLDNDAELTFTITRNGVPIHPFRVYIGASGYHPVVNKGTFSLNKTDNVGGHPNTNKDGIYIYYTNDPTNTYQRWYLQVVDGYVFPNTNSYNFQISTNGKFYDAQYLSPTPPANITRFTGTSRISMNITPSVGGQPISEGLSFIADLEHYILDFGQDINKSRLSIYKDASGYLNFRVYDNKKTAYTVSSDISSWKQNQPHMVAASWKLNTRNSRDEMHLFIDGLEVPNIVTYGQSVPVAVGEKFRTVDPEEILGPTTYDIVGSDDLVTIVGSPLVTSSINFSQYQISSMVHDGYIFINEVGFSPTGYTIIGVNGQTLTLDQPMPSSITNGTYSVNQTQFYVQTDINTVPNIAVSVSSVDGYTETELPGVHALYPDYIVSQDQQYNNILTITNGVLSNEKIYIRTLGLNYRGISRQYYVWSNELENVLMTQLPPPICLDQADITKIILPRTVVGPSNSTLVAGVFVSNPLPAVGPSNSQNGRTIQATISGTNVDFSTPVEVTINGVTGIYTISETITFTNYGTLDFANPYISVNYIQVNAKPLNPSKNVLAVDVREKYPITHSEFSGLVPVVKFSYQIDSGYNLSADGTDNLVTDGYNLFSYLDIGNCLIIHSPSSVAGFYTITGISSDRHSVNVQSIYASFPTPLPTFTGGIYTVLNTTNYRSGLQNGFFTFEYSNLPGQAWFLGQGFYELDYPTYLSIKFDHMNRDLYFGSDFLGQHHVNAVLNQATIYSIMLSDTRIGEVVPNNTLSVTKDYNFLKATTPNANTLVLITFNSYPFTNTASFYADNSGDNYHHFQSDWAVNDNFEQSVVILDKPIMLSNTGILNTQSQGTIEFWMSPLYDTANDPNVRYYFDAYGAVVEEVTSVSNVAVKISAPASQILSVTLSSGDPNIDYFADGQLEIDTQHAIQETSTSSGNAIVMVSQPILQVITVKIVGDSTGKDYFGNGSIGSNGTTIYLGTALPQPNLPLVITYQSTNNDNTILNTQVIRLNRRLPAQNSVVTVKYIPKGLQGDRISVFKDEFGYINFSIVASGTNYTVSAPTYWARNTWHRVKASYFVNGTPGSDEMRLFLDGYQYTDVTFGNGQLFGQFPNVMGAVTIGDGYSLISSITFKDPINDLYIGTDYAENNPIFTLLDNFRISNISRPVYAPFGEPIDVNYSSNLSVVFPVTQDLYTTYLANFDVDDQLITNFATLVNRATGAFDFTVNIFDSFGIVSSSAQVQQILENLINILQPANCRAFIHYIPS